MRTHAALRFVARLAAGAAIAALAGCVTLPDRVALDLRPPSAAEPQAFGGEADSAVAPLPSTQRRRKFDERSLPLAHGQIIVSESGGSMSLFYSLFAVDYLPWVHAGIVAIEAGEAVVYEADGDFFPVPGLPPTATVRGAVRRVSVQDFARGKRIIGLYALPPEVERDRLVAFAREQYERGTPFDPYFDTDDASALYCTELVARALVAAGATKVETTPLRDNVSLALARDWLRLRSRRVYLAGRLVEPRLELGRWSADLSRSQIDAYFAIKRELHRRFDANARLGHLFSWNGTSLRLRDSVTRFMNAALAASKDPRLDALAASALIERLAHEQLDAEPVAAVSASIRSPIDGSGEAIGAVRRTGDSQVTAR
jgi:hypothetical protein